MCKEQKKKSCLTASADMRAVGRLEAASHIGARCLGFGLADEFLHIVTVKAGPVCVVSRLHQ